MKSVSFTFLNKTILVAAVVLLTANHAPMIATATAGELDLSDAQNAKLSRHRARERVSKNEANKNYEIGDSEESSGGEDDGDCGTVDIGNVVNNKGFGGPKQIDVIITGDIINANNKCS